jgi:hypothetical protein
MVSVPYLRNTAPLTYGPITAIGPHIQLFPARPTVAPHMRGPLIPPTAAYPADFVFRCLIPRAPLIQ